MAENKKLQLRIEQLEEQLNEKSSSDNPGHLGWDVKKIVAWIMRIENGTNYSTIPLAVYSFAHLCNQRNVQTV